MSTQEMAEEIARLTAGPEHVQAQAAQTRLRLDLAESWEIPMGAKILEVGCGQGDMTAVLAHAVGGGGHVTAVDLAPPNYGAPATLGEATARLKETPLGPRIEFHFECDLLDPTVDFPADAFDLGVFAHCSWYFESLEHLGRVLRRVQPWARRLCLSEWDLEPRTMDQVAHLLAVLIQGQVGAYHVSQERNVRTPFSRTRLRDLLAETGWRISRDEAIDSTRLQDAQWEIRHALEAAGADADTQEVPPKLREFLSGQADTLQGLMRQGDARSLHSYAIVAERADRGSV